MLSRWSESSINSNHWIQESFIRLYSQVIRQAFWPIALTNVQNIAPLKQVWSLGFLCTTAVLCDVFVRFFYLIFWNVIKLFARFSKYWSHNHCIWFVLWWKHRKWKHADFRLSFTRWRCLFHQGTFLFLLCSSNTSLE